MSEQKLFGDFVGMLIQNLPVMSKADIKNWIGQPTRMQKVLEPFSTHPCGRPFVQQLNSTFRLVPGCSLPFLLQSFKCCDDINEANFPIRGTDQIGGERQVSLLFFDDFISTEGVITAMSRHGCRAPTVRETLAFGSIFPDFLRMMLVGLGQVSRDGRVVCIKGGLSDRAADLSYHYNAVWSSQCCFLGIHN
jgi:hypothetical protein